MQSTGQRPPHGHNTVADQAITALSTCSVMVSLTQTYKYRHTHKHINSHINLYEGRQGSAIWLTEQLNFYVVAWSFHMPTDNDINSIQIPSNI